MSRRHVTKGLGATLRNEQKKHVAKLKENALTFESDYLGGVGVHLEGTSVLEQTSLEDLLATIEVRKEAWAEETGDAEYVEQGVTLLSAVALADAELGAAQRREIVSIPRRPQWVDGMSAEDLAELEKEAFMNWRREIAQSAQADGLHLTPFERNLDFWRQLWRCCERSDLLVQIVDARDPDFYISKDLGRYVDELGGSKRMTLLVNKADFLTHAQRKRWAEHFAASNIDAIFFSALHEVQLHQSLSSVGVRIEASHIEEAAQLEARVDPIDVPVPGLDDSDIEDDPALVHTNGDDEGESSQPIVILQDEDDDVIDSAQLLEELRSRLPILESSAGETDECKRGRQGTIGFVGYPNVGKSTVINAIVGSKKVGMSKRPGKTKHIQTIDIPDGITLCDCPGLVFPSVVATKAHLVINSTVPLGDLGECWAPIQLIVQKMGYERLLKWYNCAAFVHDADVRTGQGKLDEAHNFLAAFAISRQHRLRIGVPDHNWAIRKVLRDYVKGDLLHCEPPPGTLADDYQRPIGGPNGDLDSAASAKAPDQEPPRDAQDDDFGDLDSFLCEEAAKRSHKPEMTKRKARHLQKKLIKGVPFDSCGVGVQAKPANGIGACFAR